MFIDTNFNPKSNPTYSPNFLIWQAKKRKKKKAEKERVEKEKGVKKKKRKILKKSFKILKKHAKTQHQYKYRNKTWRKIVRRFGEDPPYALKEWFFGPSIYG
jgi:hypothetical protein